MAVERFLRYSLEHGRPIRGVLILGGALVQKTFTVLVLEASGVTLRLGVKGTPLLLPLSDILSCDYARGDHGDA
jgi:hypothetical protein